MSRVSIVIPCHNDGRYLPEAIASARAQTHPDTEIILVDDHSTDQDTLRLLARLREEGLIVLSTAGDARGPSAARNVGIAHATGQYILPLDADDSIAQTYVAKGAAVLDGRPDVGICYCKARFWGLKRGRWELPPFTTASMLLGNKIFATALFRKSDWVAVGGYAEDLLAAPEDYDFWLSLLERGVGVYRIDEELFYYRIRPHSRTARIIQEGKAETSLHEIRQRHRSLYELHADEIFFEARRLLHSEEVLRSSFLYRCILPIVKCELWFRFHVKRLLRRS